MTATIAFAQLWLAITCCPTWWPLLQAALEFFKNTVEQVVEEKAGDLLEMQTATVGSDTVAWRVLCMMFASKIMWGNDLLRARLTM